MSTFAIQFNTVQGVTSDLRDCFTSLNGYKGSLDTMAVSLDHSMEMRYYASIRKRLNTIGTGLEKAAKHSSVLEASLDKIIQRYLQSERILSNPSGSQTRTPYGTIPSEFDGRLREITEKFLEIIKRKCPVGKDRKSYLNGLMAALLLLLNGRTATDRGTVPAMNGKEDYLDRLSDLFDFPGDVSDAISHIYDIFDNDKFDESGAGGFITGILGVLSGGADLADSKTVSELYRNAVDFGKDGIGALKDMLSMFKHADIIPDNNVTAGLLFGLKAVKNAAGFSVSFMEDYENNKGNIGGFIRDSGDMADDLSKFVQGVWTSKDGFLKGLKGKNLIAAELWGTSITSLYTAGSYTIGNLIEQSRNGELSIQSIAESAGKGAVKGGGKIYKLLTLGLAEPDMDKTWNIYKKHAEENAKMVNWGKNWFSRGGLTAVATAKTFLWGTGEAVWSTSWDAAEKIVTNADTAYHAVKDAGTWVWNKGKDLVSSIW